MVVCGVHVLGGSLCSHDCEGILGIEHIQVQLEHCASLVARALCVLWTSPSFVASLVLAASVLDESG
eukprot:5652204-Amphidinium_carterae.1